MRLGFDWDTTDMSILLHAKLAKPMGTARIIINNLHIKGDVCTVFLSLSLSLSLSQLERIVQIIYYKSKRNWMIILIY